MIPVTCMRMKKLFAWRGMKADITKFIKSCLICQQSKPDRSKLPGLLQPLSVPESAWQIISMDCVEGLPISGAANCILVVVDFFTKYAHFLPLHHHLLLLRWPECFWIMSISCMVCLRPLCRTGIVFSLVSYGRNYLPWQMSNFKCLLPTTHSQMAKLSV